jgi:hypothetical protein
VDLLFAPKFCGRLPPPSENSYTVVFIILEEEMSIPIKMVKSETCTVGELKKTEQGGICQCSELLLLNGDGNLVVN